ncbi:deoxyribonuclease IV, partial [Sesbania bispinosa]
LAMCWLIWGETHDNPNSNLNQQVVELAVIKPHNYGRENGIPDFYACGPNLVQLGDKLFNSQQDVNHLADVYIGLELDRELSNCGPIVGSDLCGGVVGPVSQSLDGLDVELKGDANMHEGIRDV